MSYASYNIGLARDSGLFDVLVDYAIDAYNDPETGESFGNTSWVATYGPVGGPGGGGSSGFAGESESVVVNIGLLPGEAVANDRFSFTAMNTFSAVEVHFDLNVLVAALATGDKTVTGTDAVDVMITGAGEDLVEGGAGNDLIDAGDGRDTLFGGAGADRIHGGTGNDRMTGGAGDDYYVVDSAADIVVEQAGGGYDTVFATSDHTLDPHVERLVLDGFGFLPLSGTGNDLDNRIDGTFYSNMLRGLDGNDTLFAHGGNDTLEGGAGNDFLDGADGDDRMTGGAGDDTYVVDSKLDRIAEGVGGGIDTVRSGVDYRLGAEVENLVLLSAGRGIGNAAANTLVGSAGADRLEGAAGNDRLEGGAGTDRLVGGGGGDRLIGGAGQDRADYGGASGRVVVDLTAGAGARGDAAGDTYDGIENVLGGDGNDTIKGDGLANVLDGGLGNDTISGMAGNDIITGGAGADRLAGHTGIDAVSYRGSAGGVTVDLALQTATGGDAAGDTLSGFENASGGLGGDTLHGSGGANSLFGDAGIDFIHGGDGNDVVEGGAGSDTLTGGNGFDFLSYAHSKGAVSVDLATGIASGSDAGGDSFEGFENLRGGALADVLGGDSLANRICGAGGDDTLSGSGGDDIVAGGAGADFMTGGAGNDLLDYSGASSWVVVSLASGTAYGTDVEGDIFSGFENLTGGASGDILQGDGLANRINGGAGGDRIDGAGGADRLTGGAGDDGFVFQSASGRDTITDFQAGAGSEDIIHFELSAAFDSFSEIMAVASAANGGTMLDFGPDTQLMLLGVDVNALVTGDFSFG